MCYNIFVPENLWKSGDLTGFLGFFPIFYFPEQKKVIPKSKSVKN